jgi:hypothetical protein
MSNAAEQLFKAREEIAMLKLDNENLKIEAEYLREENKRLEGIVKKQSRAMIKYGKDLLEE